MDGKSLEFSYLMFIKEYLLFITLYYIVCNFVMSSYRYIIWVFPKIGVPQNAWVLMETLLKWMIWGYHHFRKPPYIGMPPLPVSQWSLRILEPHPRSSTAKAPASRYPTTKEERTCFFKPTIICIPWWVFQTSGVYIRKIYIYLYIIMYNDHIFFIHMFVCYIYMNIYIYITCIWNKHFLHIFMRIKCKWTISVAAESVFVEGSEASNHFSKRCLEARTWAFQVACLRAFFFGEYVYIRSLGNWHGNGEGSCWIGIIASSNGS